MAGSRNAVMRSPRASTLALQTSPWMSAGGFGSPIRTSSRSASLSTLRRSSVGNLPASWAMVAMELYPVFRRRIGLVQVADESVTLQAVGVGGNIVQPGQELCCVVLGTFREAAATFFELHQE